MNGKIPFDPHIIKLKHQINKKQITKHQSGGLFMNNTGIYNANTHNTDQNIYSRQNFKQYHTNKSNICGISDDKTDCSRQKIGRAHV